LLRKNKENKKNSNKNRNNNLKNFKMQCRRKKHMRNINKNNKTALLLPLRKKVRRQKLMRRTKMILLELQLMKMDLCILLPLDKEGHNPQLI
jgi:hypothetical protein